MASFAVPLMYISIGESNIVVSAYTLYVTYNSIALTHRYVYFRADVMYDESAEKSARDVYRGHRCVSTCRMLKKKTVL